MRSRTLASIDSPANLLSRKLTGMPVRELCQVRGSHLEVRRNGAVALAASAVASRAEALIQLLAALLRQVLGDRGCQRQNRDHRREDHGPRTVLHAGSPYSR